MKNLYLLKTDKPSRLFKLNGDLFFDGTFGFDPKRNHHIYIISEKIPIEGEPFLRIDTGCIFHTLKGANPSIVQKYCRKVIITTDHSLEGVQQIDDEFLKWFVKNPTCEFVDWEFKSNEYIQKELGTWGHDEGLLGSDYETYVKEHGAYKIIIPKEEIKPHAFCETPEEKCTMNYCDENGCQNRKKSLGEPKVEPKQETIEEDAEKYSRKMWGVYYDDKHPDCAIEKTQGEISVSDFIAGAKWQQERDYELIDRYVDDVMGGCNLRFKDWLNR